MLTQMVPMRDGIRLATDIHLPPGAGAGERFPVIIERTPYGRDDVSGAEVSVERDAPLTRAQLAQIMARRGYVVVMQDVRGRGGSEGRFEKYVNEAEDGVDTFDWILAQDWCDGRICSMGLSYGAHTQLAAAVGGARGIAAMSIDTGGLMDLWRHSLRLGGGFELKQLTWCFRHAAKSLRLAGRVAEAEEIEAADLRQAILHGDWRKGRSPLAAAPDYEATLLAMWQMRREDPLLHLPSTRAAGHFARFPDVPVLLMGSWFDPYAANMCEMAAAIAAQNRAPLRRIMGPWLHGRRSTGRVGDADFGPGATLEAATGRDWITLRLDWFDFALRRGPAPLASDLFYRMEPCQPPAWPKMGGEWLPSMLNALATLPFALPDTPLHIAFDPADPFPTLGGGVTSGGTLMAGGMFDHAALAPQARSDVAVLRSGRLDAPLTLAGTIRLAVETALLDRARDLSAVLMLSGADGSLLNITDGFRRIGAEETEVELAMLPTFFRVPAGAELLLVLTSANFPRIDFANGRPQETNLRLRAAGISF